MCTVSFVHEYIFQNFSDPENIFGSDLLAFFNLP